MATVWAVVVLLLALVPTTVIGLRDLIMELGSEKRFNVSCATNNSDTYRIAITSSDERVLPAVVAQHCSTVIQNGTAASICDNHTNVLTLRAQQLGITTLQLSVDCRYQVVPTVISWKQVRANTWEEQVRVIRAPRLADTVFNMAVAIAAIINSFSLGCATPVSCVWRHLQQPATLLLASACQFVAMPLVALALSQALRLGGALTLGLFTTACIPGGGMSHVMVTALGGDTTLSISINLLAAFITTCVFPLWLLLAGWLADIPLADELLIAELWLFSSCAALALGVGLCLWSPSAATAILTWISKPLALLVLLLAVTVGASLNSYMFSALDSRALVAVFMLPACAHVTGLLAVARGDRQLAVTMATEIAVPNCALALCVLRWSLHQPIADLSSAVPAAVLITCPAPAIMDALRRTTRICTQRQCAARKRKKHRTFCIVAGLGNVTTLSSAVAVQRQPVVTQGERGLLEDVSADEETQMMSRDNTAISATTGQSNGSTMVREKITAV